MIFVSGKAYIATKRVWDSYQYAIKNLIIRIYNIKNLSRSYQLFILLGRGAIEDLFIHSVGSRCSRVVERVLMVRWVVESIPHSGPIELSFVPASVALLVYQRP